MICQGAALILKTREGAAASGVSSLAQTLAQIDPRLIPRLSSKSTLAHLCPQYAVNTRQGY